MKRKRDKRWRPIRLKYDGLLWGALFVAFGTETLTRPLRFSQQAQVFFYSLAGFLLVLYVCLSYGDIFKRK